MTLDSVEQVENLVAKQIELEEQYSHLSILAGIKAVQDAYAQGRADEIGVGQRIIAAAFDSAKEELLNILGTKTRGTGGKYRALLRRVDVDVLVVAGLREVLAGCASPDKAMMQDVLRSLGKVIETEVLIDRMMDVSQGYTDKTLQYLEARNTKNVNHRYRTFSAGATSIGLEWEPWSSEEKQGAARLLLQAIYDGTGLFEWKQDPCSLGKPMYELVPSPALAQKLNDAVEASKAVVKYPPMLVPPLKWESQFQGGYLTEWFQGHARMMGIRGITKAQRRWVQEGLAGPAAAPVRSAMNKAQEVPYRVNVAVLDLLGQAMALQTGILGLPRSKPEPQPEFPMVEGWDKDEATPGELDQFKQWKLAMHDWYSRDAKRKGQAAGIYSKLVELRKYKDIQRLYFPTFIDWRGRLYFRSSLNPQSNDAVKGCLEFAEGKRLGERGLFWLKVHIANSAGYDKHDPKIKAAWVDEHWPMIEDFINDPLNVDAPEPDTAFTLYQAGLAFQEALELDNPEDYICHVPVAMDATCSGLQHFSALLRDEVGGLYTNLVDNGLDQKSDIYRKVAEVAESVKPLLENDPVILDYWKEKSISRSMAKRPVMTYVYGSTLKSTMDYVSLDMDKEGYAPIYGDDGKVLYSQHKLSVCIGKALRHGVEQTVPAAAEGMAYLQKLVRKSTNPIQWVSPVGVPVVNWAEGNVIKTIEIRSMGIWKVLIRHRDGKYDTRAAANGIAPNFVHSLDSAHLCMTINHYQGQIVPIHDSFATHPCDVDSMHTSLRTTFVEMYQSDILGNLANNARLKEGTDLPVPEKGGLDLNEVLKSRFMFC